MLQKVTDAWNITSKVHCVVTDSAANIKRAVRLLIWHHLACFAHLLNFVVTYATNEDTEHAELIQKVKTVSQKL